MPIRGMKASERTQLNEMLEAAFKGAERDHRFLRLHQQKPILDDWSRVYEYDPEVETGLPLEEKKFVAHCGIWPQKVQYGHAQLWNGGVRDVGTHPVARGKGYGQPLMADALDYMLQREVDFSILFSGANHFYELCGYRGGMHHPSFAMTEEDFERWMGAATPEESQQQAEIQVRIMEEADLPRMVEFYETAGEGLYFAAHRTLANWQDHFGANPQQYWSFLIAEKEGEIVGYIEFDLKSFPGDGTSREVVVDIQETRAAPNLNDTSNLTLGALYHAFFIFLQNEALPPTDHLLCATFHQSKNAPIIGYLLRHGYHLEDKTGMMLGTMCIVTNPYTLFERLAPEIQARLAAGALPQGQCWVEFDRSGKFPGGARLAVEGTEASVEVARDPETLEAWRADIPDGIMFNSISDLTLFFAAIVPAEEWEDEGDDAEGTYIAGNGKAWLVGLFSNVTYDHANLDHY